MYIPQYQASWPHTVSSVHASLHLGTGSIPALEVHHPSMPPCQGWWLHSRGITRRSRSWLDYVQPPSNYLPDAVLHSCRRTQSRYRNGWFVYFSKIFIFLHFCLRSCLSLASTDLFTSCSQTFFCAAPGLQIGARKVNSFYFWIK